MISEKRGKGRRLDEALPFLTGPIRLRWRMLSYLVPWLGTVAAFFFLLFPESPTENLESPLKQALEIFVMTPLLAALGLAHFFQGSDAPSQLGFGIAVVGLLGHAGLMLSCRRLAPLAILLGLQLFLLGIGVAGFHHFSEHCTDG